MSNASDAERILFAVIDAEISFESVADVRAFIQNEWKADRQGLEAAEPPVVEVGAGVIDLTDSVAYVSAALDAAYEYDRWLEKFAGSWAVFGQIARRAGYVHPPSSTSTRSARVPDPDSSSPVPLVEETGEPRHWSDGMDSWWLIERGQPEGQAPTMWVTGDDYESTGFGWTEDVNKAMRWALKDGAEQYIAEHFTHPTRGPSARAVEHAWFSR